MILCLGTTPVYQRTMIFERVSLDGVNRAKRVCDYASGKSVNAARVIHTLGGTVLAGGFVGGPRGRMLRDDLEEAGVPHDFVTVFPQTRQCITVIDALAATATELVEEAPPIESADWARLETRLSELLPRAGVWVFSGTLAPGAKSDFYARRLPLARQSGVRVIIDAAGEPLKLAMRHPNVTLKVNRAELATAIHADLSDESALIKAIREHVPREGHLIVTLGVAGALASDGQNCWRVRAPAIKAISAVGSGDAFAGGLALAFSQAKPFSDALKLAAACGAANALTALAGHLERDAVEKLAKGTQIEAIAC